MRETGRKKRIVVILGPTASGKSTLAIRLARRFNGEVISADSRQMYRGMDIGTGKVTAREARGIPHHLLDIADPRRLITAQRYRELAIRAVQDVWRRGRVPILCGGTGFYIRAVIDGTVFPAVKPNGAVRRKLEKLTAGQLFTRLRRLDPDRAATIDPKNPHRLIRAIEIASALGSVPKPATRPIDADILLIGVAVLKPELARRISSRLLARIRRGMIAEVRGLHAAGVSWQRLDSFGLEYRYVSRYLRGEITRAELVDELDRAIRAYAKRQMTWFKRDTRIHWVGSPAATERLVRSFLA